MPIVRQLWVNDKDGNPRLIRTIKEYQEYLKSLSPEDYEKFKEQYRWTPITNFTGNPNYTGTLRDL